MTANTGRPARAGESLLPIRLGINIDHIATLRNARGGRHPDPLRAAELAVEAGADNITAHLREDRRHIRDEDIARLAAAKLAPLNLEMAVTSEMLAIALKTRPHACCPAARARSRPSIRLGARGSGHPGRWPGERFVRTRPRCCDHHTVRSVRAGRRPRLAGDRCSGCGQCDARGRVRDGRRKPLAWERASRRLGAAVRSVADERTQQQARISRGWRRPHRTGCRRGR